MKKIVLISLGVLVVIRILLPLIILAQINKALDNKLGVYQGHVDDVDLNFYRSSYKIQKLEVTKRNTQDAALLFVEEIDFSLAWRAILKKNITLDITIKNPTINLSDSKQNEKKQQGFEEPIDKWNDALNTIVPISIETLKIHDGTIIFRNLDIGGNLKVEMNKIEVEAKNLRSRAKGQLSPIKFSAILQNHAPLSAYGHIEMLSEPLQVDLDFKIEKFNLTTINKTLRYYIPVDISKGVLSAYGEAATSQGKAVGYAKVFFSDGDIIAKNQYFVGAKHFFIEIAGAFGHWFLKNKNSNKVAFVLPFSYDGNKFNISGSDVFWSAVKNSNTQLKPGIEQSISLEDPALKAGFKRHND